jgi:serine protease Do
LVTDVPEGPAREAGMESGDVILSFDGVEVDDTRGLVQQVANTAVGAEVRVLVFRDGETETLRVTLGRREEAESAVPASVNREEAPATADLLGLTISGMTDELREQLGLAKDAEGLVVAAVAEDSEAFEKGLRVGDIITEAAQESVASIADLNGRVEAAREAGRKSLVLLVRRDGDPRFVALTLDDG